MPIVQDEERELSKKVNDLLVVWMTGMTGRYIAEVIKEEPLLVKIMEVGPYTDLREYGDFGIMRHESLMIQDKDIKKVGEFLKGEMDAGRPLVSGLARFGVTDMRRYIIITSSEGENETKAEQSQ